MVKRVRRDWLVNGTLSLGVLVLALVLSEGLVRLVAPQELVLKRPDIWKPDSRLGWVHHAGLATTVNTGGGTVRLYTDERGFRVGAGGRRSGEKTVLVLGDSFMEALQVEYEETVPSLLEQRLPSLTGHTIAVRNAAVGGWDPPHYLRRLHSLLEDDAERYDLVLGFIYLGNDVVSRRPDEIPARTPKQTHPLRWPRSLAAAEVIDAWLYPINDFLETRSHLFVLAKRQLDVLLMRLGLTAAYFPEVLEEAQETSARWRTTADICADMTELAGRFEVPSLFVLLPAPVQVEGDTYRDYVEGFGIDTTTVDLDQPNRLLGRELEARGVALVDATRALREAYRRGDRLYGEVDRHFTAEGHRVVALDIEDRVAELLADWTDRPRAAMIPDGREGTWREAGRPPP